MSGWEGAFTGILDQILDLIEENKEEVGVNDVQIGERRRGWQSPVCFVMQGAQGTPKQQDSGRRGLHDYGMHVRILVVTRKYNESDDANILGMLERIADLLDDNPLQGVRDHDFTNPAAVSPTALSDQGLYETVGQLEVIFFKVIERSR